MRRALNGNADLFGPDHFAHALGYGLAHTILDEHQVPFLKATLASTNGQRAGCAHRTVDDVWRCGHLFPLIPRCGTQQLSWSFRAVLAVKCSTALNLLFMQVRRL